MLVLTPQNCPSEQAQRAQALIQLLSAQSIPVLQGSHMSFSFNNPSAGQKAAVERAVAVFNAGASAVFIKGIGMSNPSPEQAAAEYHRSRNLYA